MSEWVSVEDRLPDDRQLVLAARWQYKGCDPDICVARVYVDDFYAFTDGLDARNYDGGCNIVMDFHPTHWMPLPDAPK